MKRIMSIDHDTLEKLNNYINADPWDYPNLGKETLFEQSVSFSDGNSINICVMPPKDEYSTAYAQAILYNKDNAEIGKITSDFSLDDTYSFRISGEEKYSVLVLDKDYLIQEGLI